MKRRIITLSLWFGSALFGLLARTPAARATPTQDEVFKSIQQNVGESGDSGKVVIFLCAGAGFIILMVLFNQRSKREISPRILNHQGKLLKEIGKGLSIRPKEMKQLKILAEQTAGPGDGMVESPLTLLLCPSVLMKAVQNPRCKADRRVLQQILRKTIAVNPPVAVTPPPPKGVARVQRRK